MKSTENLFASEYIELDSMLSIRTCFLPIYKQKGVGPELFD